MEENQNLVELYNALHKKGVTAASNVSEFKMLLDDEKNRKDMYDALNKKGVFSGTYDEFQTSIGYELNQQPAPARVDVSDVERSAENGSTVAEESSIPTVTMEQLDQQQVKYPFPSYYPQYRNDDANPSVEQKVKDDGFVVPSELTEENFKSVKQRRDKLNKRLEEIGKSAQHLGQMGFMAPKEPLNALSEEAKKIRSELETIDGFIDSWNNTDESRAYLERQKQRVNDVSSSIDKAQEENNRNRINRQIERDSKLTFFGRLAKSLQAAENPITPEVVEALTDPTTNGLRAAKNEVRNADKQLQLEDMRRNGEMKGLAFIRGLETANYYELIPAIGMADAFAILDAKQALEEGRELNQSQQLLLEAMEARAEVDNAYQDNNTIWERLGRIAPEQLMFTAQFVVGAGVTGATKVGERVAAKSAERAAVKYAKKGVKSSARRFIGGNVLPKLEGMAVSSAMQTFANPLGVAGMVEDFERRYAGDIYYDNEGNLHVFDNDRGAGKAAYQAIASAWIENFTEYAGENITKSAKLLDSKMFDIAGKFDNVIKRVGAGKIADVFSIPKQLGQITQIGSAPEEFLEEELGSVMNALFATDAESGESYGDSFKRTIGQSFSGEQQLETLLSCAITSMLLGGGGNAVNAVGNAGRRKQANRDVEQSKALLGKVKGIIINELDNQIENGQIKDIASYLKQQSDANGWSQDEQGAAVSYVMNRTRQIGIKHNDDIAIEEAQQEMRQQAEDMANRWDGNIYNATWKDNEGNEQPVTIINGRIHYTTRENGTIHFNPYTSSGMIAIRLADGTKKQVPSRTITGIQSVMSVDEQLEAQGNTIPQMMQAQFEQEGMAIPTVESVWGGNLVANETQFENGKYTYLGQDQNGLYAFANNDKKTQKDNPIVYMTERQLVEYGLSLNIQTANATGDNETAQQAQDDLDFMQHLDELTAEATEKDQWDVLKAYASQYVGYDENGSITPESNPKAYAPYLLASSEGSFDNAIASIDESIAAWASEVQQQSQAADISGDAAMNAETHANMDRVDGKAAGMVDFYTNVRNILLEMQKGQQEAIEESLNEMPVSQMEVGQEFPVMYDGQQAMAVVVGKDADGRNVLTIRDQDGNDLESGIDDWEDEQWDVVRVKAEDSSVAEEPEPVGKGSFGYIYDQFRGKAKEAVEFLIKKKSGEAIGALSHRSVGEIDIVWGDEGTGKSDGFGLAKLVKYHPEVIGNLQELLDDMEVVSRSENRVNLESKTHKAGVRLDWDGVRKTWLMTMFEKKGASEPANGTTDITGNQSGLENDTAPFQNPDVSAGKDNANSDTTGGNGVKNSIPRDKDGNIDHSSLNPDEANAYAEAVSEEADNAEAFSGMGDPDYIKRNLDAAGKEVEKAEKRKPKATNASKLRDELSEINRQKQSAKAMVAFWNAVDAELKRRQAERIAARQAADDERYANALAEEEARKAEDARKKAEQEQLGANNVSDNIREKWNNSTKIEGNADEITLANGERIEGHYYLVESGSASASHDATEGFKKTEGFPVDENGQTVNDRDYEGDMNAQQITRTMAQNYDSRAAQEAPVVSQDGIVMSGNGRTMAGELAALNNTDGAYIEYLNKYPHKYGFTTEQVGGMSHPRVVFVPNERMPYTTDTFAKFNQQGMKGQSKTEQAVKLGKIVDDATFGRIIRSINRFDTLGDFYADSNATGEAIGELQKAGAINQMQHTEMFDGETISETGKQMLENMLIGKAFESNPDAVRQLAAYKSLRQSVITALAEISNNIALGEYSLESELSQAIELAYNARSKGYKAGDKVSEFAGQTVLFAEDGATAADFTNATVMMLADLLNDNRVTRLKKALQVYNNQAVQSAAGQMDLFSGDVKTKEQILDEVLLLLQNGTEQEQQEALDKAREQRKADAGREESVQQDGNAGESNQGERVSEQQQTEPAAEISDEEVESVISSMKEHAVTVPFVEITDNNWRDSVETPIGEVKMGENQKEKLFAKGREQQYGMLLETLGNPDIILEERDKEENIFHERPSSYLFVKTFQKEDGTKYVHFESVTVSQEGMEISVSSHIIRENQLRNKVKSDRLLYKATALDEPAHPSAGQPTNEGVSLSSGGKDTQNSETQAENAENSGKNVTDNGYTITPSKYTTKKGKVLDMQLVKFDNELGKEQQRAANSLSRDLKGWWSRDDGGFLMRDEATAHQLIDAVLEESGETLQDAAPLSLSDMRGKTEQTKLTDEAVAAANEEADTKPTEAQKEAGNYKKGHVKIDGFDISIENPAGSTRSGTDAQGNPWKVTMHNSYGYIRMTEGVDGDHIDVFLSDDPTQGDVFVVDQVDPSTGKFDEHKVMYGFGSAEDAKAAYLSNYEDGWNGLGAITEVSKDEFKKWIKSSHRKTKPFSEYKSVDGVRLSPAAADDAVHAGKDSEKSEFIVHDGTIMRNYSNGTYGNRAVRIIGFVDSDGSNKYELEFYIRPNEIGRVAVGSKIVDENELKKLIENGIFVPYDETEMINDSIEEEEKNIRSRQSELNSKDSSIREFAEGIIQDSEKRIEKFKALLKEKKSDTNGSEAEKTSSRPDVPTGLREESREEMERRLNAERKQRILSEGTSFDKPFGLVPVSETMTVEDIDTNMQRIAEGLKANEGNKDFGNFYGFAYQGNFKENAGQQLKGYYKSLTGVVDPKTLMAWAGSHGFKTYNDVVEYGKGLYDKTDRTKGTEKAEKTNETNTEAKDIAYNAVRQALANAGIEVEVATEEEVEKLKAQMKTLQDSKGVVRGWVGNDGKIHLTKDGLNAETPIHEYTHLWAEALQMENPELWEQIKDLLKDTPEWNRIASSVGYKHIRRNEDRLAGEVLAHISGKKNAERMEAEAKRMIDEAPTLEEAAKAANLLGRMRDALKKFWTWVGKTLLGKKGNINIDQVSNMVLADLTNGIDPFNPRGGKRTNRTKRTDASIEDVNERFNEEIEKYKDRTLPAGHRFDLGQPSAYLRSAGFPNLPISMRASLLARKAGDDTHPFDASDLHDLVDAIQKPIAVFKYSRDDMRNLIVDVKHGDKHFLVGVTLNYKSNGIEINSVSGLFPKDSHEWIKWIQDKKAIRIDQKEKVLDLINSLRTNPAESERIGLNLDSAANIVENFENPQVEGENFSDADLSIDEGTDETDRTDVPEMSDEEAEQYDAGRMTFTEIATEGVIKAAEKNKEDLRMRNGAVKAIGMSLNRLRQAMAKQKEYDKATVDSIVRLARMMIENGYMDNMSRSEVKRLMTLAKNATGKTDITKQANAVVDLMLKHQLKAAEAVQQKLLSTKGSKVNASGVEVQAGLDITGQRTVKAMKEGIELDEAALAERIADVNDRMGGTDKTLAANAAEEYEGLMMAKDYHDMIRQSEQDEAQLRHELDQAKEDVKNGTLGRKDYKELAARIDAALRKNMAERVTAFTRLNQQLAEVINGSKGRAREFREKQMERVREIQHNANSDMKGTSASEHKNPARINKVVNSGIVRFFFNPVATFDEMLRFFGKKSVDGMGYLWQRFMGGYIDAADTEWRSLKKDHDALDEKVSEVMGEKMRWSDLFSMERRMKPIEVEFYDTTTNEDGEAVRVKEKHPLTQGNALYIYMVNKMDDGAMKLRRMGITDEDVDRIAGQLDPRFLQLADWIQDEFLPKKREAFNAVHMRMFGAPMAAIEEYFPLVTNSRSRGKDEDISEHDKGETKPSTITGSIIKRTVNTTPLDVTNADAFDVLLGHLRDMEHWAAFAELNRDMNTLLSYKRFKNQVLNTSSVRFGAGETLWNNFKDVCAIAADVYHPKVNAQSLDNAIVNISKGVTSAKISFRLYTALKQLLSYPAYFSEANPVELAKSTGRPAKAFNWALDNLPGFAERWQSRQAGDSRLKDTDADWDFWKNKFVDTARRWGMTPNAFVDGITVAMGAKAIYESKLKRYLKDGYSEAEAKEKALKEASAAVNETQQSSQNAYLSAMQLDRTVASVALTVFRNASMGYERRLLRAVDNIKRKFTKGYKEESIEFMRKKMVREGLTEEQAKAASERAWNISIAKDVANVVIFGYVMQLAWNLGSSLMYLIFGDDDDEKERMWEDAALHALAGPVEGLSGGSVISEVYNMARSGKKISNYNFQLLPIMSDLQTTMKHMEQDKVRGIQDIVNLLISMGVGVNPQTITDAAVAIVDAADGDLGLGKEIGLCALRIMQVPQSQLDQLYIDELGMSAKDAKGLPMDELAQRYAAYKRMKDAPLTGWAYSDEAREKVDKRYVNKFVKLVQERVANMDDEALERNMDDNDDLMLKKQVGKEVASRLEGKDTYGNQPPSNWKEETKKAHLAYQQLRGYVDLCEDVVLQKAQADADKAYEAALEEGKWTEAQTQQMMAKGIEQAREQLNKMRRQLGQGNGQYDQQIMENIRAMRSRYMEYYGLKGKKE